MSTDEQAPQGTFACPICGHDKPHPHSDEEIAAYRDNQMRGDDGWTSCVLGKPTKSGWYLCLGIKVPLDQKQAPKDVWDNSKPQWSQLSWFLWVREGAARDMETRVPEVLYYDHLLQRWSLRNLLGNAVPSGEESRWAVIAYPKYWRSVPALGQAPHV